MNIIFREAAEADYPAIIALHKSEDWGLDTPRTLRNFQEQGNMIIIAEIMRTRRSVVSKQQADWVLLTSHYGEFAGLRNLVTASGWIFDQNFEINGTVIGKMDLMQKKREGKEFLYVERLIISKEYRNKGVGKKFLAFAEAECKKRHLQFLDVAVRDENYIAKKLYLGHGFQVIGKKVYMRKNIK